ncbi:hypothetical protein P4053_34095 [Pseudomonas aeruginosa]|nr:hypothetical protein [Pseudomonas aeruginosa]
MRRSRSPSTNSYSRTVSFAAGDLDLAFGVQYLQIIRPSRSSGAGLGLMFYLAPPGRQAPFCTMRPKPPRLASAAFRVSYSIATGELEVSVLVVDECQVTDRVELAAVQGHDHRFLILGVDAVQQDVALRRVVR